MKVKIKGKFKKVNSVERLAEVIRSVALFEQKKKLLDTKK
jgi:hypothetical protein